MKLLLIVFCCYKLSSVRSVPFLLNRLQQAGNIIQNGLNEDDQPSQEEPFQEEPYQEESIEITESLEQELKRDEAENIEEKFKEFNETNRILEETLLSRISELEQQVADREADDEEILKQLKDADKQKFMDYMNNADIYLSEDDLPEMDPADVVISFGEVGLPVPDGWLLVDDKDLKADDMMAPIYIDYAVNKQENGEDQDYGPDSFLFYERN